MPERHRISGALPLRDCPEGKIGIALPRPISDRLDGLVSLVEEAAERTSRKELLGALILAASPDVSELVTALRRFRHSAAGDARLDGRPTEAMLTLAKGRPGPRPRKKV